MKDTWYKQTKSAGSISEEIRIELEKNTKGHLQEDYVINILKFLSQYKLKGTFKIENENYLESPYLAVIDNWLQRGIPTKNFLSVEKWLSEEYKGITFNEKENDWGYNVSVNNDIKLNFNTLHLQNRKEYSNSMLDFESEAEAFFYSLFKKHLGIELANHLVTQPELSDLFDNSNFKDQRLDFLLADHSVSKKDRQLRGYIFEVDGFSHRATNQKYLDDQRDKEAENNYWKVVRFDTNNQHLWEKELIKLKKEIEKISFFNLISSNEVEDDDYDILQTTLGGFAINRVLRTIIDFLIFKKENFVKQSEYKILLFERDITCGKIAFETFNKLLKNLFDLSSTNLKIPNFIIDKFDDQELNDINDNYDLLLDISILEKTFIEDPRILNIKAREVVRIRSCDFYNEAVKTKIRTSTFIKYTPIVTKTVESDSYETDDEKAEIVTNLLRELFWLKEFRPGQLPIISRALSGESVIGLLPTGGGKSLTFQLSALMQPGICLIVAPLRTLMADQCKNLIRERRIDATNYINSSLTGKEKGDELEKLKNGEKLFSFISPERLQMTNYRHFLEEMSRSRNYFNYVIIDEAHCVSEWGHDFRPLYLNLGKNALMHCKSAPNINYVPLFGLTATASYDVLADIQRELSISKNKLTDEAVIRHDQMDRPELRYKVINCEGGVITGEHDLEARKKIAKAKIEKLDTIFETVAHDLLEEEKNNKQIIIDLERKLNSLGSSQEKSSIRERIKTLEQSYVKNKADLKSFWKTKARKNKHRFDGEFLNSGVVFLPHTKGAYGVHDLFEHYNNAEDEIKAGYSRSKDIQGVDNDSISHQDEFIDHKLNLLFATKGFGMGIDKPNIRFTVHFSYPTSLEGFVQEAGRAGRDRKIAISYILFNKETNSHNPTLENEIDYSIQSFFYEQSFKGELKEKFILFELLNEIRFRNLDVLNKLSSEFSNYQISKTSHERFGETVWINPTSGGSYVAKFNIRNNDLVNSKINGDISWDTLNKIRSTILSEFNQSSYSNLSEIFAQKSTSIIGIEKQLINYNIGDELPPIHVPFEGDNDGLCERLSNQIGYTVNKRAFNKFINFGIDNIERDLGIYNNSNLNQIKQQVKTAINQYRDEKDTLKGIYRLSIIGVIDDFEVDYLAKVIKLKVIKKDDTLLFEKEKIDEPRYINSLYRYVKQYFTEAKAISLVKEIHTYRGNNDLQKMLGFLIEFLYDGVAKRKKANIQVMHDACLLGIDKGGKEFGEYIDLYFNSKYAKSDHEVDGELYSLKKDTDEGKVECISGLDPFTVIKKFIDVIDLDNEPEINNLKHLRGASTLLLQRGKVDNGVLLVLKAYSIIRLYPDYRKEVEDNIEVLANGILQIIHLPNFFSLNKNEIDNKVNQLLEHIKGKFIKNSFAYKSLSDVTDFISLQKKIDLIKKIKRISLEDIEQIIL